jgi:hypothetical protein
MHQGSMYVVAIAEAPGGATAEELAAVLGLTPFEARLALAAVQPHVVLRTPLRERAVDVARRLVQCGYDAIALDRADVVPVERMVHLRRFAIGTTGLRADSSGPTLAFDEVSALVRVAATTAVLRTTREKEIEAVRGRRTEGEVERTHVERATDHALFLFPRSEGTPWVLCAGEARYLALGPALRPTSIENFLVTVALLRERAPQAPYDERFAVHPLARQAQVHVRGFESAAPELGDDGVEVPVQLLARWLTRARGGPYRTA